MKTVTKANSPNSIKLPSEQERKKKRRKIAIKLIDKINNRKITNKNIITYTKNKNKITKKLQYQTFLKGRDL